MFLCVFQNEARGKLYVDDGHSFDYKKGSFLLREFRFSKNKLTARYTHIHLAAGHMIITWPSMVVTWSSHDITWFIYHSSGDPAGSYATRSWLERVIVVGFPSAPNSVKITSGTILCIVCVTKYDSWSLAINPFPKSPVPLNVSLTKYASLQSCWSCLWQFLSLASFEFLFY